MKSQDTQIESSDLARAIKMLTYDGLCGEHDVRNITSAICELAEAVNNLAKAIRKD